MATEEDLKKAESEDETAEDESSAEEASAKTDDDATREPAAEPDAEADAEAQAAAAIRANIGTDTAAAVEHEEGGGQPVQLGYQRYVYAAYMAGAMLAAFLAAKIGHAAWYKLGQWKPELGEPKDEILYPIAGLIGVLVALYYWRKPESRQYANEVAEELSKVTWPSRKEVSNSTLVVVFTTVFATVYFALMDRFWGFITDKIYTF